MNAAFVMTLIGPDRPGLVQTVASLVAEHGGNWLESRMAHLGGHFAGILRIELPTEQKPDLLRALDQLKSQSLSIVVHEDQPAPPLKDRVLKKIEIIGQDRPGIVRHIAQALAHHGVNVEELHTECQSAPMSGETLFKAEAEINIPSNCDSAALQKDLEQIASDLIVDISLLDSQGAPARGNRR